MTIRYATGDLFAPEFADHALAHGCNCAGAMGLGIAREFRARWPAMYEAYRARCRDADFLPGDLFPWRDSSRWVFNLMTQQRPGARASTGAIAAALARMREHAVAYGVARIAMPWIGCGLGGLNADAVRPVIERAWNGSSFELVVVALPEAE